MQKAYCQLECDVYVYQKMILGLLIASNSHHREPAFSLHHEKSFIQGAFWTGITARGRLSLVIQTGRSVYRPGTRFS